MWLLPSGKPLSQLNVYAGVPPVALAEISVVLPSQIVTSGLRLNTGTSFIIRLSSTVSLQPFAFSPTLIAEALPNVDRVIKAVKSTLYRN